MNIQPILDKYEEKCRTESDINHLLPYIFKYASDCDHCTELGVRSPTSTYAFLASNPKKLVSYDIARWEGVTEAELLAKEAGIDFEFILGSTLEVEIEPTDMIFYDTYHSASQLRIELQRHADKSRKYLAFHDVITFGRQSEPPYENIPANVNCGQGLMYAIEEFLAANPHWQQELLLEFNNGLLILKRV